jgi:ankyrin repeat protein
MPGTYIFQEMYPSASCDNHVFDETVMKVLLEKGADIESKDNEGRTALMRAAIYDQKTIVKLLLEKGADVNSKDNAGHTALWFAYKDRHQSIVDLLLQKRR